jgi:DNA-binding IclR family transcriptional regulator
MAEKKYIQSVDRALDIVEFIARKKVTKLNEVSEALSLKAPTAHALMKTLEHRGYIQRVGKTQYSLGLNSLKLGLLYEWEEDSNKSIHRLLQNLVEVIDETAYFEFKIGDLHYFYDTVLSTQPLKVVLEESHYVTLEAHSAVNKVYLNKDETLRYEIDLEGSEDGLNCMAIPFRTDGIITATIAFTGPSFRFTKEKMEVAYQTFLVMMEKSNFKEHI